MSGLRRVGILLVVGFGLLAGCSGAMTASGPTTVPANTVMVERAGFVGVRAVVIVRHADIEVAKKALMGNATPLTKRGEERGRELAYALKDAGVTRIVTTEALRTKETAAALAKELGITPEVASGSGMEKGGMPMASEAAVVMEYLARTGKKDDVILLVHHHSVIPSILAKFGYGKETGFEDATEFDRMYVVLPEAEKGTYQVVRVRYGAK